jgi:hypothetical protein
MEGTGTGSASAPTTEKMTTSTVEPAQEVVTGGDLGVILPRTLLHPLQREIAEHPARFKCVAAGRRFGKSKMGAVVGATYAIAAQRVWWITPSYKLALVAWRDLLRLARRVNGATIYKSGFVVTFPSGGSVTIRSAHDPESLRSEGLDLAIFDEAAFIDLSVAWKHAIRPALMDRHGRAYFLSTPFGQNAFFKLWKRGLDWKPGNAWKSWRFKSWENPYLPADERAAMQEEYDTEMGDDAIRRQETEAEFLDEAGGIFRGIEGMLSDDLMLGHPPHRGCTHILGWDPAKFEDYNATILIDETCREVVLIDRTRRIDLTEQLQKIVAVMKVYHGRVWMDATRDETLVELAQQEGLQVDPIKFTAASKQDMVSRLAIVTERARLKMPRRGTETLVEELRGYRYQLSKWGGGIRYGAPAGDHDDTVTALGLCVLGLGDRAFMDFPADYVPAIAGKPGVFVEDLPRTEDGRAVFA